MSGEAVKPLMCEDCIRGAIHSGKPVGSFIPLGALDCYYSPSTSPSTPSESAPAIVFIADIFGYNFVNSQLLCDVYARGGFNVYMPDFFRGGGAPAEIYDKMDVSDGRCCSTIGATFQIIGGLPAFLRIIRGNPKQVVVPLVNEALRDVRSRTKGKVGTIGFCFGGRYSIISAGGEAPLADAYIACHPSLVDVNAEIPPINRPGLFLLAASDYAFPASALSKTKTILNDSSKSFSTEFKEYPGTKHGFTVRGGPSTQAYRVDAAERVVEFFKKHLTS